MKISDLVHLPLHNARAGSLYYVGRIRPLMENENTGQRSKGQTALGLVLVSYPGSTHWGPLGPAPFLKKEFLLIDRKGARGSIEL